MANKIGLENLIKLCDNYGGLELYIPQTFSLASKAIKGRMAEDYKNGETIENLIIKYGISKPTLYSYIGETIYKKKIAPLPGQIALDEAAALGGGGQPGD